ncbi:unnamed protein product [Hydatigera taeniaeformis]|uniref:Nicastrin n=1 Tax=Hydatigena taeniaeformis TaxID=6205 RepID=A0A0R3X6P0_HYDTA|nr:unnamed protein product [Hydatigera taeniaeformis]
MSFELFYEIPDRSISHCSRKLSVDSFVGCSSKYPSSVGEVLISDNFTHLQEHVNFSLLNLMIVIPLHLFITPDVILFLRRSENVAGLFVFSPSFPNSTFEYPSGFSENTFCPNGDLTFYNESRHLCDGDPKWNPPASEYATISWPFPVVLAEGSDTETWNNITDCYNSYNVNPSDDTRCYMEIRNFMSAVKSSQTCYSREVLLSHHFEVTNQNQIGGVNLMLRARALTATNPNATTPDPTLLVVSRIDALSMFDRRATSALAVLPAVSVMVSAAAHLLNQPDIRAGRMRKNLFFLFLDNEALSFMGSQRFLFDLTHERIAQASGLPLNAESVESVIELANIGLPQEDERKLPIYYLLSDPDISRQVAGGQGNEVLFLNGSIVSPTLLPPSSSTQPLLKYFMQNGRPLSHIIISDRPALPPFADTFVDSFLDTRWPPSPLANEHLLRLANLLADMLHRVSGEEITEDSLPIPEPISGVKPAELMNCFLKDPGCNLLRMHLDPEVVNFLLSLKGPIPMQTYEPVDGHSWRVSHVVSHLLMGLTGHRLKKCPPSKDFGAFTYMYGYYNGSTWCYQSLIETVTSFFFLEDDAVAAPGWVRSVPFQNQRFVRLFRSASSSEDKLALALGIVLTAITAPIALFMRAFTDRIFPRTHDPHHQSC